ncbi:hypothetical protein H2199_008592 [Coniosporium tulheliwenetii]|uniref:Uncharacterized protein n=1 Tax=Coniosporium tulheliwenetii TaxID=3383036 RepID=A0ACC2YIU0_9PEZI|nr:hypothetical protein H2199_008592 [Cladosporium sp. JES 115]
MPTRDPSVPHASQPILPTFTSHSISISTFEFRPPAKRHQTEDQYAPTDLNGNPSTHRLTATHPPKRASTQKPALPPPPSTIHPTALIANHAVLSGTHPITIAAHCIIHPYARIVSAEGPVELGEGVVVWEHAAVEGRGEGVRLERGVVVESGARVEGAEVGEGSLVGQGCGVGVGCVVGKHCKIAPRTILEPRARIPDFTIVYGANNARRVDTTARDRAEIMAAREKGQQRQMDALRKLVPSNTAKWMG